METFADRESSNLQWRLELWDGNFRGPRKFRFAMAIATLGCEIAAAMGVDPGGPVMGKIGAWGKSEPAMGGWPRFRKKSVPAMDRFHLLMDGLQPSAPPQK